MLRIFCVLLLVLAGCQKATPLAAPEAPPQGSTSSGGGESTELEFKLIGRSLVRRFKLLPALTDLKLYDFEYTLNDLRIETTDVRLEKDGRRVDALNYPAEGLIRLVRPRWDLMSAYQRERLVTHEILGLMKVDDTGYHTTDKLTHALGGTERISFYQVVIQGPVADVLVSKVDWQNASIVGVGKGGSGVIDLVQLNMVTEKYVPLACEFSGNVLKFFNAPKPLKNVQTTDAHCMLNVQGCMEGGSRVYITVSKDKAAEILWQRLGGTETRGFSYPSIQGIVEKGGEREIRIELSAVEHS